MKKLPTELARSILEARVVNYNHQQVRDLARAFLGAEALKTPYTTQPPVAMKEPVGFDELMKIVRDAISSHSSPTKGRGFHEGETGFIIYEPYLGFVVATIAKALRIKVSA